MIKINDKLRQLRLSKNLTQEEIANVINIKQSSYSSYEIGRREPDLETLVKIADLYKISVDQLLGRPENNNLTTKENKPDFKSDLHKKLFDKINELEEEDIILLNGYVDKLLDRNKEIRELQYKRIAK